jgi:ubiquitin C-terminal hydrolase
MLLYTLTCDLKHGVGLMIYLHVISVFNFQLEVPAGLTNLGNTCYMNATIQCLRSVPELKESLKK